MWHLFVLTPHLYIHELPTKYPQEKKFEPTKYSREKLLVPDLLMFDYLWRQVKWNVIISNKYEKMNHEWPNNWKLRKLRNIRKNENINDFIKIKKSLEDSGVLINGVTETVKDEIKKTRRWICWSFVSAFNHTIKRISNFFSSKSKRGRWVRRTGRG